MPSHYKKKPHRKKRVMKKQLGGSKKKRVKKTMCMCHQNGGMLLSPAQLKMLKRPIRRFNTLPVKTQKGMGHCGKSCHQCGGNIFDSIGKAFKRTFSNPARAALAIGSLGMSETFLQPLDLLKSKTGIKGSQILDVTAPIISAVGGPELALGSKFTSIGLKQLGLGHQPMLR